VRYRYFFFVLFCFCFYFVWFGFFFQLRIMSVSIAIDKDSSPETCTSGTLHLWKRSLISVIHNVLLFMAFDSSCVCLKRCSHLRFLSTVFPHAQVCRKNRNVSICNACVFWSFGGKYKEKLHQFEVFEFVPECPLRLQLTAMQMQENTLKKRKNA